MNAERLHAVVLSLNQEISSLGSLGHLDEVVSALKSLVAQPGNSTLQEQLKSSLDRFYSAVNNTPSDQFSPTWRQIMKEIGADDFFGLALRKRVETTFAENQMTPAVALRVLQELRDRFQGYKTALEQAVAALRTLKIGSEKLSPGAAEIGVLIPRSAVDNQLLDFAKELNELGFILNTFSEVATGKPDPLAIQSVSSSEFLIFLKAAVPYAACLARAIERVVELIKQMLDIRRLAQETKQKGAPEAVSKGLEEHANNIVQSGIEKLSIEIVNEFYESKDSGRKNELKTKVRFSLNKIANRLDIGFNIEVRVEPLKKSDGPKTQDEELQKAIALIQSASSNMKYLKLDGEPILKLPEGTSQVKHKQKRKTKKAKSDDAGADAPIH